MYRIRNLYRKVFGIVPKIVCMDNPFNGVKYKWELYAKLRYGLLWFDYGDDYMILEELNKMELELSMNYRI